jgi:hypothetical protein
MLGMLIVQPQPYTLADRGAIFPAREHPLTLVAHLSAVDRERSVESRAHPPIAPLLVLLERVYLPVGVAPADAKLDHPAAFQIPGSI